MNPKTVFYARQVLDIQQKISDENCGEKEEICWYLEVCLTA